MVAPHFSDLAATKRAARAAALGRRAGDPLRAGEALGQHLLAADVVPPGAIIAGVWPLAGEIDLRPLMLALHGRGHPLVLPVTPPRGQPLAFRRWQPGAPLAAGPMGTFYPAEGEVLAPELLLVPLLAFDRAGGRLGYGGGYYDRTLAALPGALPIGVAFACQEMDHVPRDGNDALLPMVATERGLIRCTGPSA